MRQTPYPENARIINVALPDAVKRRMDELATVHNLAVSAILRGAAEALAAGRTVSLGDIADDLDRQIAASRAPKRAGRPRKKAGQAA